MYFYTDLSDRLLKRVTSVAHDYQNGLKTLGETEDDSRFFTQMTADIFHSKTAFNERSRINHLMLKATIDSVP
ncbi:hypothetical protein [Pseudomonas sp. KBW05]|jgi:hypothetical protein|uniref:hypothetical protein n=1 Tax=Pseudomonas sp. KBW05 TaxID=2153360 RepID=UPI000F58F7D8|nr:hypothetical protein [Pseudomonas sp. KBW05]RQO44032.1 hypothetical protein DBR46_29640 [Pseudomonas sp. KBW05]